MEETPATAESSALSEREQAQQRLVGMAKLVLRHGSSKKEEDDHEESLLLFSEATPTTIAKTKAKKQWYVKDGDLTALVTISHEENGNKPQYKLVDVIGKAVERYGFALLYEKVYDSKEKNTVVMQSQYAQYTADKLKRLRAWQFHNYQEECNNCDTIVVQKSWDATKAALQKPMDALKHQWKCYEMELMELEAELEKAPADEEILRKISAKHGDAISIQFEIRLERLTLERFEAIVEQIKPTHKIRKGNAATAAPAAVKRAKTST